ncbi:sensor histidine kinase [Sinomonas sp. P10A9]|uniref:Sensor histidine kinase n=1 Tax=Sinomonas puerhi TaxID=3238584 RepID=A0AB39L9K4_9MICC
MPGTARADGAVKTRVFHAATAVVVAVVVLAEVALPVDSPWLLRLAVGVVGAVFLVAGASVYLYSRLHESLGCLALNVVGLVLVYSVLFSEDAGVVWTVGIARAAAGVLPTLLVRSFFEVVARAPSRRAIVRAFDVVAVFTEAFLIVGPAVRLDDEVIRLASEGVFLAAVLAAAATLVWLASTARDRDARAGLLMILAAGALQASALALFGPPDPGAPFAWLWVLSSIPLPLTVSLSALRGKFVDLRLRRELVYVLLTGTTAGAYAAALAALSRGLHLRGLAAAVAIAGISILFVPTVRYVHRAIDRWFYRDGYDYRTVLSHLATAAPGFRYAEDLGAYLCSEIMEALNLSWCAIYAGAGAARVLVYATDPLAAEVSVHVGEQESAGLRRFTLGVPGSDGGQLVVALRNRNARLRAVDEDLLRTMAYQAGIVLENYRLIDSLDQRIRGLEDAEVTTRILHRRLAESEERTRARLSRDLHDGALQSLFHLVRVAEGSSRTGAAGAGAQPHVDQPHLDQIADLGRDIAFELRQVCEDLRPPMLDQLSLPLALEALVARYRTTFGLHAGLAVKGEPDALPSGGHLSSTLYRVASEALSNVLRHAQADEVELELEFGCDRVWFTVRDDGRGFAAEAGDLLALTEEGHLGLAGMFERIRELDGTTSIARRDGGGTDVRVSIPYTRGETMEARRPAPEASA